MSKTKKLVLCALLCAVGIVCKCFLSFPVLSLGIYSQSLSVTPVPVMLAGVILGPWAGAAVGAITDIVGALIVPRGAYFPGFTVAMALYGLIPGLFFMKRAEYKTGRLSLAILAAQAVSSLGLNTLFVYIVNGTPYGVVLINRLIFFPILYALHLFLMWVLLRVLGRSFGPPVKKVQIMK